MRIPEFKNFFKQDSQIQGAAAILGKFKKRPNIAKKKPDFNYVKYFWEVYIIVTNLFNKITDSHHHLANPGQELHVGLNQGVPVEAVHPLLHLNYLGVKFLVNSIVNLWFKNAKHKIVQKMTVEGAKRHDVSN